MSESHRPHYRVPDCPAVNNRITLTDRSGLFCIIIRKKGKLDTSHRYNLLPLLRSSPGGIQRELVVYDFPGCKGSCFFRIAKKNSYNSREISYPVRIRCCQISAAECRRPSRISISSFHRQGLCSCPVRPLSDTEP